MHPVRIASLVVVASSATAFGQFQILPWTFTPQPGASGTLSADTMIVVGPNIESTPGATCSGGLFAEVHTQVPVSGLVIGRFAAWQSEDAPIWDYAAYRKNGVVQKIGPPTDSSLSGFGPPRDFAIEVASGDSLGLGTFSVDCQVGNGISTFTDLRFHPAPKKVSVALSPSPFGIAVANVGDWDGDGAADPVIGIRGHQVSGVTVGRVEVRSAKSPGTVLVGVDCGGSDIDSAVGTVGDFDGDGRNDFVFSHPGNATGGNVRLFSSATSQFVHTWNGIAAGDRFGAAVAGIGDLDGDGISDLAIGSPKEDGGLEDTGSVRVYSTATKALRFVQFGLGDKAHLGAAVAAAGDVDLDGFPDVVVGAASAAGEPQWTMNQAFVFSGATGAAIRTLAPLAFNEGFGFSVAGVGDVNDDGSPDLVVGAPRAQDGTPKTLGRVDAFSGRDATVLWRQDGGSHGSQFGVEVALLGDTDGIEGDELLIREGMFVWTSRIVSARDGATRTVYATQASSLKAVAALGDVDGDQRADFVEGGFQSFAVISPRFGWNDLGHALAGVAGEPELRGAGVLAPETPVFLRLERASKRAAAITFVGVSEVNQPFLGGTLVPAPNFLLGPFETDAQGKLALDLVLRPALPSGLEFALQTWIQDPAAPQGFSASNGLRARIP